MAYVERGVVKDKRTIWRLSIISDFFRAIVNFIRIFFLTMRKKQTTTGNMALVRNGMVDLVVVVAHMAAEVVVVVAVPVVLARFLTFDPMTTVLSLLVDPAAANKRTTFLPDDSLKK
nr:unnamed protein product [Digitaria exilis]